MRADDLRLLWEYSSWATTRILDATAKLTTAQWLAPAIGGRGGVQGILTHMLAAEMVWRQRCQEGISPIAMLRPDEFGSLAALQEQWQVESAAMRNYLAGLSDPDLDRTVSYASTTGMPFSNTLWHILTHVINHATQHRAEAAMLLTGYGHSPGDLDFIVYLRNR